MGNRLGCALALILLLTMPVAAESEPPPPASNPWRAVFFTTLGVTVGLSVVVTVSNIKTRSEADKIDAVKTGGGTITDDDCDAIGLVTDDRGGHFQRACAWRSRGRTAMFMTMGFGAVTAAAAILAFAGIDSTGTDTVSVTPSLSPDGASASLRLRF